MEGIPKQRGCPTCGCTLWSEQDDVEPAVIRDAIRWRRLREQWGGPDSEAAASGQPPEWLDALAAKLANPATPR